MDSIIQTKYRHPLDHRLAQHLASNKSRQQTANLNKADDHAYVIDQACIFERLRREKQRVQRSGSALSVLVVKQNHINGHSPAVIRGLLKAIQQKTRETDVAGYIDQRTLGVVLPYTDQQGASKIREKLMADSRGSHISITTSTYPDQLFDSLTKNACVPADALKLMVEDPIRNPRLKLGIKRGIDIAGSVLGFFLLSPLLLLTAMLVKCSSPGPIIFRQKRVGHKGEPFTFYKFRSMRIDADDQIHRDYVVNYINGNHAATNNGDNDNPLYKIKSDPRVTRIGRFIRKASIDALPQLYNVLKGDMSLVGPRPPLFYETEKYQPWQLRRILDMKPGITGLWQVEGRGRTGFDEAVRLDIKYLQTWSIGLDIKLLCKTAKAVLRCTGAV